MWIRWNVASFGSGISKPNNPVPWKKGYGHKDTWTSVLVLPLTRVWVALSMNENWFAIFLGPAWWMETKEDYPISDLGVLELSRTQVWSHLFLWLFTCSRVLSSPLFPLSSSSVFTPIALVKHPCLVSQIICSKDTDAEFFPTIWNDHRDKDLMFG